MSHNPPHPDMVLCFPLPMPSSPAIDVNTVVRLMSQQQHFTPHVPYRWTFVDKPNDGDVFLTYLPNQARFPNDGLKYFEAETTFPVKSLGEHSNYAITCVETKGGFIPGVDNQATRIRRRFYFSKGPGNPNLVLVHYSKNRDPAGKVVPPQMAAPARAYPLPLIPAPFVFIAGPRLGETVSEEEGMRLAQNVQEQSGKGAAGGSAARGTSHNDLTSHAHNLKEQLSRKDAMKGWAAKEEEYAEIVDEENISIRTLSMNRYRRNHELMEEVLYHAAFGQDKSKREPNKSASDLSLAEIEEKLAAAEKEVAELTRQAEERRQAKEAKEAANEIIV